MSRKENNETIESMFSGILPPIFDTHSHLLDDAFDDDREIILQKLADFSVLHVIEAACKRSDIDAVIRLCRAHPGFVYGAAGIHPHHANEFCDETLKTVSDACSDSSILAIGEIGLDYYYDFCPRSLQKDCLDAQLSLAGILKKPVILHDREAHGDCLDLLRAHKAHLSGTMHCFSGSYETAKECLDLGLYLGIGGSLTFKNARKLTEMLPKLPLDRLLLETDCPYLTPEPFRGKRNDSRYIRLVIRKIAELRPESEDTIAAACLENGCRLFGI